MSKLKITAISDTHTKHSDIKIEPCDILVHAGDYSYQGRIQEVTSFLQWFSKQSATHKIFINGNHEVGPYESPALFKTILSSYSNVIYLNEELVEVEGLKIYGYPITSTFFDWSYMRDRGSPEMLAGLAKIPTGVDIILSHGPAAGILDIVPDGSHAGCEDLLKELDRIRPKVMICGHLHSNNGFKEVNNILHVNASILNDQYQHVYNPKTIYMENGIWKPEIN